MATCTLFSKLNNNKQSYINADELGKIVGLNHTAVLQVIRRNAKHLEAVSRERLNYRRDSKGRKIYLLNTAQATLLVTFMQTTDTVANFSTELVRKFYLTQTNETRDNQETIEANKALRKAVAINVDESEQNYKKFYELAYLIATGKSCKQLREIYNIPDGKTITNFLSDRKTHAVNKAKYEIAKLLVSGFNYQDIKLNLYKTSRELKG